MPTPDEIKRAVKEALADKAIDDLSKQLTALSTQMTQGFSRVETRQDVANGKLMKHETKLEALQKAEQASSATKTFWERNQDRIIWAAMAVGLMLFYFLLTNNGFPKFLAQ